MKIIISLRHSEPMKRILALLCLLFFGLSLLAQESSTESATFDASYFYGSILVHNKDISHLVTGHPQGIILSYNKKTFGNERWEREFNYPDWGYSFIYQDGQNEFLGKNYGVFMHLNFYFLKRNLQLRLAQGVSYNTNPFDLESNFKNNAYGSHLLITDNIILNYSKENIFRNIGLQAGITFIHYSNANAKAPNTSTNTLAFNLGLKYTVGDEVSPEYIVDDSDGEYSEPIGYNFALRGGINESDFINLGQHPFFIVSAFADKRVNFKSSWQLGIDFFYSKFLEKEIEYRSIAFPEDGIKGDEDFKRVGLFAGHEFHFNKFAINTQLGYYVYYPYDFEGRVYERLGLKYYFGKNLFAEASLKAHVAKAEAIEFGIGIRL